ncbi:aldo/keto reductase [Candidatus Solincola tengchongensis]|uniref:aldo/keto reductase n=1 Tax=Candidatus Solincola tengchongensis TaxID=2900693 RepID=UPI00257B9BC4|nr:aldo/keto reductase [Candidatus Solincola tengchongensis]
MLYRRFGSTDWEVSILGFGCMRLPTTDGIPISENVNLDEAAAMIIKAVEQGINYLDTAYTYHNGRSESILGEILGEGYREKVRLATKCPVWLVEEPGDFDRFLDEQLGRLRVGHIDYYLFHGLNRRRWEDVKRLGLLSRAEKALADGRIGGIGFSFHDHFQAFREMVDGYDGWCMCQIQYNYMDVENQAGERGLRYAAEKGLAVVVMEPLLGGNLARPPREIAELFESFPVKRTPAEWALLWLWEQPGISTVLSGMSTMRQLEENLRTAELSGRHRLSDDELGLIEEARHRFLERAAVPCTGCGYCKPCPNGVDITENISLYNSLVMYDDQLTPRFRYHRFLLEGERASACTGCGECEDKCPQGIKVGELMPEVHAVLGEGKAPTPPAR